MAPFRFAVQVSNAASTDAWRALARKSEDLGYSTLYIPDHMDDQWAPLIALTVAAEATTTLRVGTLVLDNDFRHPVVLAKEAATMDVVTGGRFELGMGAGWMRSDYEASGIPMEPAAVRIAMAGKKALRGARTASDRVERTLLASLTATDRARFLKMLSTVVSQAA